ncbi:MAG: primosomal protein N' [Nitrospinales bacterium]
MTSSRKNQTESKESTRFPRYIKAVFNLPLKDPFTYEVPENFLGRIREGMRVLVPFGHRRMIGYVVALSDRLDPLLQPKRLKFIEDVPDSFPVVSAELLKLTRWIADYYQSSWGEAIKAALPSGLETVRDVREKWVRIASFSHSPEEIRKLLSRSPKQKKIYDLLLEKERKVADMPSLVPSFAGPLRQLKQKGLVETVTIKTQRAVPPPLPNLETERHLDFVDDQEKVYRTLSAAIGLAKFSVFLLHGVTGSGKTEVYIRCIQDTLAQGRQAIMMVPEISLTPQTVNLFRRRFGNQVAILHSGLSHKGRYLEWEKIFSERVSIVVGARSAVFAPFKNLGIVIIDEEHDPSYKQDSNPRYHARDTAVVRARNMNAVAILGSATPSLESRKNAECGKYVYLSLPRRIQDRFLPIVKIADMRTERSEKKNFSILSMALKSAIRHRLDRKEQVFLFLNRRGTANYVFCQDCGHVFHCPRCSVSLTFHGKETLLRCHYCNYAVRPPGECLECRGEVIRFQGFGTQKLEEEVRRLFPQARLFRMDRDTARKHSDFETMFDKMTRGEIDILVGTQMITKGHDFPKVTLVGVVHADLSLNIPDFRSGEKSFQLLTQVAGRAGRGVVPGQVILQSFNPSHYVYDFVRQHDYEKFYEKEMRMRRRLNYPPFTRLVGIEIESRYENRGQEFARKMQSILAGKLSGATGVELLGPSRAALFRVNEKFRWRLLLRSKEAQRMHALVCRCPEIEALQKSASGKVKLTIDVDPVNLL